MSAGRVYSPSGKLYRVQDGELCDDCSTRAWTFYRADNDERLEMNGMSRPCDHKVRESDKIAPIGGAANAAPKLVRDITESKTATQDEEARRIAAYEHEQTLAELNAFFDGARSA